jgi:hypothetical protein
MKSEHDTIEEIAPDFTYVEQRQASAHPRRHRATTRSPGRRARPRGGPLRRHPVTGKARRSLKDRPGVPIAVALLDSRAMHPILTTKAGRCGRSYVGTTAASTGRARSASAVGTRVAARVNAVASPTTVR